MSTPIDPSSPVPLYHQIAEEIRERIRSGELAPGQALEPLRQASETWGVNLHTVRHAYTALARDGLVETRGPRGTRVRATRGTSGGESLDSFLARVVDEARRAHRLDASGLAEAIRARRDGDSPRRPTVYVIECSAWQCDAHVGELRALYDVDARPWPLGRGGAPPTDGVLLSTFFHYNDVRRAWPRRLRDVHFLTIGLDRRVRTELEVLRGRRKRLCTWVVEHDEITAENIAADLSALLPGEGFDVRSKAFDDPSDALQALGKNAVLLFAPRAWAALNDKQRRHAQTLEARYVFDSQSLAELGSELGWPRLATAVRPKERTVET